MRFIYGGIAFAIWLAFVLKMVESGIEISKDTVYITLAIVTAGAMAGGK